MNQTLSSCVIIFFALVLTRFASSVFGAEEPIPKKPFVFFEQSPIPKEEVTWDEKSGKILHFAKDLSSYLIFSGTVGQDYILLIDGDAVETKDGAFFVRVPLVLPAKPITLKTIRSSNKAESMYAFDYQWLQKPFSLKVKFKEKDQSDRDVTLKSIQTAGDHPSEEWVTLTWEEVHRPRTFTIEAIVALSILSYDQTSFDSSVTALSAGYDFVWPWESLQLKLESEGRIVVLPFSTGNVSWTPRLLDIGAGAHYQILKVDDYTVFLGLGVQYKTFVASQVNPGFRHLVGPRLTLSGTKPLKSGTQVAGKLFWGFFNSDTAAIAPSNSELGVGAYHLWPSEKNTWRVGVEFQLLWLKFSNGEVSSSSLSAMGGVSF